MEKDSEIIERVKKGNKEAYGVIVKKYMRKAYSLALGFVGNTHDALDLSQTAFIKAYRSLPAFDQNRPFLPLVLCNSEESLHKPYEEKKDYSHDSPRDRNTGRSRS